jgi:hypothetical protein
MQTGSRALANRECSCGVTGSILEVDRCTNVHTVDPTQCRADGLRDISRCTLGRRGSENYDKAIADFNDAFKMTPKNARALYARAVAESRKNEKSDSASDVEAAKQIAPEVAKSFERYGIVP